VSTASGRNVDERLRLYRQRATLLENSSVGKNGPIWDLSMGWTADDKEFRSTLKKPEFEALQSFLSVLRDFDNPRDDLYLPAIVDVLRLRLANTVHMAPLESVVPAYAALHEPHIWILRLEGEDGPTLRPREAFDLWAYSEHLHTDLAKERRMRALPPHVQTLVRVMALEFVRELAELVVWTGGLVDRAQGEAEA
jgi:hypothetical protein